MTKIRIKPLKLEIDLFFLLMIPVIIALGRMEQFFILLFCVAVHEAAHVAAAYAFGRRTEKVSLTPLGFCAFLEGCNEEKLWKRLVILSAGPIANILMAFFYVAFGGNGDFFALNIAILVFNLIPVLPLDGGRVIFTIIAARKGILQANRIMVKVGRAAFVVLVAVGFIQTVLFPLNISLVCMAAYLGGRLRRESMECELDFYREFVFGEMKYAETLLVEKMCFPEDIPLSALVETVNHESVKEFIISGNGESHLLTQKEVLEYVSDNGLFGAASDVIAARSYHP